MPFMPALTETPTHVRLSGRVSFVLSAMLSSGVALFDGFSFCRSLNKRLRRTAGSFAFFEGI